MKDVTKAPFDLPFEQKRIADVSARVYHKKRTEPQQLRLGRFIFRAPIQCCSVVPMGDLEAK